MPTYKLGADKNVVGLSSFESRSSGLFEIETFSKDIDVDNQSKQDLLTDSFYSLYKRNAQLVENIPDERAVNYAIMKKAMESIDSDKTSNNLVASLITTPIMYGAITSENFIKDALGKQQELEDKKKELDQAENEGNPTDDIEDEIEQLKEEIESAVGDGFGDVMQNAVFKHAVSEAEEEADNVNAFMRGWGTEPSSITNIEDASKVIEAYQKMSLSNMSKLIGRSRAYSSKTISQQKNSIVSDTTVFSQSKDITKITATEAMMLFDSEFEELSLYKTFQFMNTGLNAAVPIESISVKGNTIIVVDESGSLGDDGCLREKAMALGICQAIKSDLETSRYYEIWGFSHGHKKRVNCGYEIDKSTFTYVDSDAGLDKHMEWASTYLNGGTDFDSAIELAMTRIEEIGITMSSGFDLTMFSDGICRLSHDTKNAILKMKEDYKMKFIYIQIGYYHNQDIKDVADVYIEIPDGGSIDDVSTIEKIVETIAEHYLNKFAMGD